MFSQYWVLELLVSDILIPYIAFFSIQTPQISKLILKLIRCPS